MSVRQAELVAAGIVVLVGLGFIAFSIPIYSTGFGSGPGSGFYPFWVGVVQTVCGVAYIWGSVRIRGSDPFLVLSKGEQALLWQCASSMAVYVAAMPYLGFALSTFLLLVFHLRVIGNRRMPFSILFSLGTTVVCAYFFKILLYVPLPRGIIGW